MNTKERKEIEQYKNRIFADIESLVQVLCSDEKEQEEFVNELLICANKYFVIQRIAEHESRLHFAKK